MDPRRNNRKAELSFEARHYVRCEFKPFVRTKHKCVRCQECDNQQFRWCKEHPNERAAIDKVLEEKKDANGN